MDNKKNLITIIRILLFSEVGCMIPREKLKESDLEKFKEVNQSFEMGLINRATYNRYRLDVCNDILLRTGFIEKRIMLADGNFHRRIFKLMPN